MSIKKLLGALLATSALCAALPATAETFPERAMRVVVPYPAGGTTDVLIRMLQGPVAAASGQSVVVDNRSGGASVIGTSHVAQSAPDGYTVLGGDLAILVNPSLLKDLPYDTKNDFRGVTMLARAPLVLLVNPSVKANTLEELIEYAKANPGKLNFASGGYGTSTHMAGEMFRRATGLDIVHVPYQGVAPAMTALLGGQVARLDAVLPPCFARHGACWWRHRRQYVLRGRPEGDVLRPRLYGSQRCDRLADPGSGR